MTTSLPVCLGLSLALLNALAPLAAAEPSTFDSDSHSTGVLLNAGDPAEDRPDPHSTVATAILPLGSPQVAQSLESETREASPCLASCNRSAPFMFRPPLETIAPVAPAPAAISPARAPIAKTHLPFGMAQISNPPLPVPTVAPASEYQAPFPPASSTAPSPALPSPSVSQAPASSRTPITPPLLRIQGVYVYQGGESSARARFTGVYPLTPNVQVGGSVDVTTGDLFSEGGEEGVSINELYLATSLQDLPNLRFVVGQLDLTSYFDRNSFAKDGASQFFNPVFQTNPALVAAGVGSRPGALVNWSITDSLEARAAVFSSDRSISDFSLDGFAGEVGLRLGDNFIVRGTYATGRDGGADTGFREVFQVSRNGEFGLQDGDREEAYGVNAELFIPQLNLGLFGRYGRYDNREIGLGGDTFVFGLTFLDLFVQNDRLGIGYGRELSNDRLRRDADDGISDTAEIYYDFEVLPNLRLGLTYQALDNFSESIAGVRIRTDFDLLPRRTP